MKLILASTSPYRKQQIQQLGIPFEAHAPRVDEESYKGQSHKALELAPLLAKKKAESLLSFWRDFPILGGDQVAHLHGKILGKPGSFEKAMEQLQQMQGQTHELITSICWLYNDKCWEHTNITQLTMRALSVAEIESYVKKESPFNCAGSYKIEGQGIGLFEKIQTEDFTSIIGIPLLTLNKWWHQLDLD